MRRDPVSGTCAPTLRVYERAHARSSWEQLRRAAERPMRERTAVCESCHLSVANHRQRLVFHQEQGLSREER